MIYIDPSDHNDGLIKFSRTICDAYNCIYRINPQYLGSADTEILMNTRLHYDFCNEIIDKAKGILNLNHINLLIQAPLTAIRLADLISIYYNHDIIKDDDYITAKSMVLNDIDDIIRDNHNVIYSIVSKGMIVNNGIIRYNPYYDDKHDIMVNAVKLAYEYIKRYKILVDTHITSIDDKSRIIALSKKFKKEVDSLMRSRGKLIYRDVFYKTFIISKLISRYYRKNTITAIDYSLACGIIKSELLTER